MHILIVAATEPEIEIFRSSLSGQAKPKHSLDFLITGVGIMSATYTLSQSLSAHKPDLVLAVGIAGGFNDRLRPGDTVIIFEDGLADLGAGEGRDFEDIFELGLAKADDFPYSECRLKNPYDMSSLVLHNIQIVKALTVSHIRTDNVFLQHISDKYDASVETLEGAAVHYVCLKQHVPFLHLRSVSNITGERDKTKWVMKEALQNLSSAMNILLEQIRD